MKFTNFRVGQTYKRKSDGKIFKNDNDQFYVADERGVWEKTTDLNLSDAFVPVAAPNVTSYVLMYEKYKNGTIEERDRYFEKIFRGLVQALDELKKDGLIEKNEE